MSRAIALVSQAMYPIVFGEPLDRLRQAINLSVAAFDGGDDEVAHVFALDAFGRGEMGNGCTIAAVESEATRTFSPLSRPISNPSEHQRRFDLSTATRRMPPLDPAGLPRSGVRHFDLSLQVPPPTQPRRWIK